MERHIGAGGVGGWAALPLRVILGLGIAAHGAQKLFAWCGGPGLHGVEHFFGKLGVPAPMVSGPFVAGLELFGGLLLVVGLLTRPVALLLAIEMVVAVLLVHLPNGFFVDKGGAE